MDYKERVDYAIQNKIDEANTKVYLIEFILKDYDIPIDDIKVLQREHKIEDFGSTDAVDYALFENELPKVFIEAKAVSQDLSSNIKQLKKYFNSNHETKLGILTIGKEFWIFTDSEHENQMDNEPLLKINAIGNPELFERLRYPGIFNLHKELKFEKQKRESIETLRKNKEKILIKIQNMISNVIGIKVDEVELQDYLNILLDTEKVQTHKKKDEEEKDDTKEIITIKLSEVDSKFKIRFRKIKKADVWGHIYEDISRKELLKIILEKCKALDFDNLCILNSPSAQYKKVSKILNELSPASIENDYITMNGYHIGTCYNMEDTLKFINQVVEALGQDNTGIVLTMENYKK